MAHIIYQEIKPENSVEEVLDYFRKNIKDTRNFKGNIEVVVCVDESREIIRLISKWESLKDYSDYRSYRESLGSQLAKISKIEEMTYSDVIEEI